MHKLTLLALVLGLTLLSACAAPAGGSAKTSSQDLPLIESWTGDYPVAALGHLPAGQQQSPVGFIGDAATFAAVWKAYMPAEPTPNVDFGSNLVVFSRNVDFYNRTSIMRVSRDADGLVEILAMETMSSTPVTDKAAMAMGVIPRAGVTKLKTGENTSVPVR